MSSSNITSSALGIKVMSFLTSIIAGGIEAYAKLTGQSEDKEDHTWQKPGPGDRRSPCPMLNALANHSYLPHDGKDITLAALMQGLKRGINLSPDASLIVGLKALQASTTGSWVSFHLDDLNKHGVIEHDGSLSRADLSLPPHHDNSTFNPEIWATTLSVLGDEERISIEQAAQMRNYRIQQGPIMNPHGFKMSSEDLRFSAIETALYLRVFGRGPTEGGRGRALTIITEEERLPIEEGFKRSDKPLTIAEILELQRKVEAVGAVPS
ncbi:Peroxidase, family 2-domain-containing protein [Sordaria brevicollis]|uniref:Peroxidase, family 2-domain-containing protein n=1 Tax=Sordaria brevicollis TaxID=83679 RepID=A0AAE0PMC5_SORBR|nr:Peroxidase, family 2-domain-containing protein [Sordaria brevicollis]